jgi:hypothetical protein
MIQSAVSPSEQPSDAALRDALAHGDVVFRSIAPVMQHLLTGAQHAIFADEIVARVRGGIEDVARQLLTAGAQSGARERDAYDQAALDVLFAALIENPALVAHVHALAIEWQLTQRLQADQALDPSLPPLLQALLASDDPHTSALAMNVLAAQARFTQTQRRMQLPLGELPADLLHVTLLAMRAPGEHEPQAATTEASIRADYDESRTRAGLIARLVTGMGSGASAALSLTHAGLAIFATALGLAARQDRDGVVLSLAEGQSVRLGLELRAAGINRAQIEQQLLTVGSELASPLDWDRVSADRAATLLAATALPVEV